MADVKLPRRDFLKARALPAQAPLRPPRASPRARRKPRSPTANAAPAAPETWLVLTPQEDAFFIGGGRHHHPQGRAVAVGSECGVPYLHRPPACQRLGRRRQDVPRRALHQGHARAGLSIAADAASVLRGRRRRGERLVREDLRQDLRPRWTRRTARRSADRDGRRQSRIRRLRLEAVLPARC